MSQERPRRCHELTLRISPEPKDINYNGHIFGGWILSQMDVAGGIVSYRRAGGPVATVAVEGMTFHQPILLGDVLSVYTEIERVGRTSITVDIEIWVERRGVAEEVFVTEGRFVYVAIDENARPRPVDLET